MHADGSAVITKHPGTGGAVTVETVTAQLLYEIGAPAYLGPDVVDPTSTRSRCAPDGPDRVRVSGVRGSPPPPTLKVGVNNLGGFRNAMTFVLCGLDIEAKAALVRAQLDRRGRQGRAGVHAGPHRPPGRRRHRGGAARCCTYTSRTPTRSGPGGRSRQAAVELALASYPGCTLTTPPGDATPYGVFTRRHRRRRTRSRTPRSCPTATRVPIPPPADHRRILDSLPAPNAASRGHATGVDADGGRSGRSSAPAPATRAATPTSASGRATDAGYAWLRGFLTVERLQRLLPGDRAARRSTATSCPTCGRVNFVIHGLLGEGVAASTRFDPQAKALGELAALPARRHPGGRCAVTPRSVGSCASWSATSSTREIVPHLADWERAGEVPRALHATAAKLGLLGIGFPEEVGGSGGDLLDSLAVTEEMIRAGGSSGLVAALFTHGIALPHIVAAGDARR